MKVIQFPNKTRARIKDGKVYPPKDYLISPPNLDEEMDRMERLRASLEKINKLMRDLKENKE